MYADIYIILKHALNIPIIFLILSWAVEIKVSHMRLGPSVVLHHSFVLLISFNGTKALIVLMLSGDFFSDYCLEVKCFSLSKLTLISAWIFKKSFWDGTPLIRAWIWYLFCVYVSKQIKETSSKLSEAPLIKSELMNWIIC